jgi:hypothetical protein
METLKLLTEAYGEDCMSRPHVSEWHKQFSEGRESVKMMGVMMAEWVPIGQIVNRHCYIENLTKFHE